MGNEERRKTSSLWSGSPGNKVWKREIRQMGEKQVWGQVGKIYSFVLDKFFFKFFFYIGLQLIYNVCQFQVYSKVIQLYIYIYLFFFRFFSHIGYCRVLSRVSCVIQQVLVDYLFYKQQCAYVNPKSPNSSHPPLHFNSKSLILPFIIVSLQMSLAHELVSPLRVDTVSYIQAPFSNIPWHISR